MPSYWVTYPTAGSISVHVEAEDEVAAIEAGYSCFEASTTEHCWEAMPYIVRGNVFYGDCNEISVEQDDE